MSDEVSGTEELREGITLWEAGRYVEAHEEFEQLWLVEVGPRRHFLRGLVHAAMGFHYVTMGDTVSAGSKLRSAADLLDGFPGDFLGLDVDGLRAGIAGARATLEMKGNAAPREPGRVVIPHLARTSRRMPMLETEP
jgi:predicted metal-dependent hydrolase